MEDERLVELVLDGDDEAFETLHDRYFQQLFQYVYVKTGNYHNAEEIIQDIFFKMAKNLWRFQGKSSFKTWLFSISQNTITDYYRKQNKYKKTMAMGHMELENLTEQVPSTESQVVQQDSLDEITKAINRLGPDYRTVLHLRLMEGFSIKETSYIMEKTTFAVKSLHNRAKKKLAECLRNEVEEHDKKALR
ncbi:RNA polymerase sigma factor [Aquibacillus saliphilus]|uniref:RNA polymerase sigma factor n=1 Tax=Aquibacillus saliphilus TaxID=1909422 RepID=UPI001CEFC6AD|nr:RNA polymerase sigma factor [Aquibacillus saliphilus]